MWIYIAISVIAGLIIGLTVGVSTTMKVHARRSDREAVGCLRLDHSMKDEPPTLYLELNQGVENFIQEPYILLKVRREDFLSR